jgi:hypothetical protein
MFSISGGSTLLSKSGYNSIMIRNPLRCLLGLLLLSALACNLPVQPGQSNPGRQTLEAQLFATRQPTQAAETQAAQATLEIQTAVEETAPSVPQALQTPTFLPPGALPPLTEVLPLENGLLAYTLQPGDTLEGLSGRFEVSSETIFFPEGYTPDGLLPAGMNTRIPVSFETVLPGGALLPDAEVVYGPPAADFDIAAAVQSAGGYLSTYSETVGKNEQQEVLSGAEIVRRVALETSTNPRLLLAVLDYHSGWLSGPPRGSLDYPIGFQNGDYRGLHGELTLTARYLTAGYYGWRAGTLAGLDFADGTSGRPDPRLNAGSIALQRLFAQLYAQAGWARALYGDNSFPAFYNALFGDPWARAAQAGDQFPNGLLQPAWELPFPLGEAWSFTGGPHIDWGVGSPLGALDFAPIGTQRGCYISDRWATASEAGVVARSERGMLLLDLDGDGSEQTGWVLLYLHLADAGRLEAGAAVEKDAPLGHPSCEGGQATGAHVHIARKYNGEWIGIDRAFPFVLSGWQVIPGENSYQGKLVQDDRIVTAGRGTADAKIVR